MDPSVLCTIGTLAGWVKLKQAQARESQDALCKGCPGRGAGAEAACGTAGPWALQAEEVLAGQLKLKWGGRAEEAERTGKSR